MSIEIYIGIVQFIVLLLSLSIHESAHAWTADRFGDPTARYLGRVSLNPMVHADLMGTIVFPLIGIFVLRGAMFGWAKPVPVNVSRLKHPSRDHMLVAAAGPISNLLLATLLFMFLIIVKFFSSGGAEIISRIAYNDVSGESILLPLTLVAYHGMMLNLLLAVFNLIPVAPLDGAAVVSGLLPRSLANALEQMQSYGFMLLLALLYLGVPGMLFYPVRDFVLSYLI
ncbi:MAG: site-2 protease family protein [Acidobacteria bacterium]|nr:MAG: site-2 protease family protein [Acidobacteriota bacterium]